MLFIVAFAQGFSQIGFQLLGSKIVTTIFGSNLMTWTIIVSVFLLSMALGQKLGAFLSTRSEQPAKALIAGFFISSIWVAGIVHFSDAFLEYPITAFPNPIWAIVSLVLILFFIPIFATSIAMPLLLLLVMKSHLDKSDTQAGKWSGDLSTLNSIGSISGALFVPIGAFGPWALGLKGGLFVVSLTLIVACLQLLKVISLSRTRRGALILVLIMTLSIAGRATQKESPYPHWIKEYKGINRIASGESFYSKLQVFDQPYKESIVRWMVFSAQPTVECMVLVSKHNEQSKVESLMPHLNLLRGLWASSQEAPKKILVIGLGGACFSHAVNSWTRDNLKINKPEITYVEVDPLVHEFAKKIFLP